MAGNLHRAAQYLRMSTDHQRYSTEHQRAAIADYAMARGYEIVRTYADTGLSGVRIAGRLGLQALLAEIVSGAADYTHVMVYDVSRWGRFQDPDEAAHYEFICRQAGVSVVYCAEPFGEDEGLATILVKQLKRAMAAEFSRDLAAKVAFAQAQHARAGFWQGGPPGYALRRRIVHPDGSLGPVLQTGESKARGTRVVLVTGPEQEVAIVARIFRLFVVGGMSRRTVARKLNEDGVPAENGARWTPARVAQVLTNEKYVGVQVFGKARYFLNERQALRPSRDWIRAPLRCAPMVSEALFGDARRHIARRFRRVDTEGMVEGLRALLQTHGRLTSTLIRDAEHLPCPEVYRRRFGGLLAAYACVGYEPGGRAVAAAQMVRRGAPCGRRNRVPEDITPAEMVAAVRAIYEQEGILTGALIDEAPGAPSTDKLLKTFGSLLRVYVLVGYAPTRKQVRLSQIVTGRRGSARRSPIDGV
jgi:DNA invertase Pin-like site-specific DNA recombinase